MYQAIATTNNTERFLIEASSIQNCATFFDNVQYVS